MMNKTINIATDIDTHPSVQLPTAPAGLQRTVASGPQRAAAGRAKSLRSEKDSPSVSPALPPSAPEGCLVPFGFPLKF